MFIIVQSRTCTRLKQLLFAGLGVSKKSTAPPDCRLFSPVRVRIEPNPRNSVCQPACLLRHVYYSAIPQLYLLHRTSSKWTTTISKGPKGQSDPCRVLGVHDLTLGSCQLLTVSLLSTLSSRVVEDIAVQCLCFTSSIYLFIFFFSQ